MEFKISRKMVIIMWKKFKRALKRAFKFVFSFHFGKFLMLLLTTIVSYLTYEGVVIAKMCIIHGYTGALLGLLQCLHLRMRVRHNGFLLFPTRARRKKEKIKMNGGNKWWITNR